MRSPLNCHAREVLYEQTVLERITRQLCIALQLHLLTNTCAICSDGVRAQVQRLCDPRKTFSEGDEFQHLKLPVGQRLMGSGAGAPEMLGKPFCEFGTHVPSARMRFADRSYKCFSRSAFSEIPRCTQPDGAQCIHLF